jgi:hypothetical protein
MPRSKSKKKQLEVLPEVLTKMDIATAEDPPHLHIAADTQLKVLPKMDIATAEEQPQLDIAVVTQLEVLPDVLPKMDIATAEDLIIS